MATLVHRLKFTHSKRRALMSKKTKFLQGIAQINIAADDVVVVRDWYTSMLGIKPYFQRPNEHAPGYVEFRLGDREHELGIIDRRYLPASSLAAPAGAIVRWHVDDIEGVFQHLIEHGAAEFEPVTPREGGFATASVLDPFGNILGLIHSPHYAEFG
jgi:predicted enzyme related to lactoylglutathione lyase